MLEGFFTIAVGAAIFVVTLVFFWMAMPRPSGPPRWFIDGSWEAMVAVALTSGLILGVGTLAAGLVALAGMK
jgi:hypothetical protein